MYSSITAARSVVGGSVEVVGSPATVVGDERARLVAPAVHVGDRDAVLLEQLLELHLVLEREERRGVGAVAAHHELERSPSRSTSTNQTGRQRACRRIATTVPPTCSRIHSPMCASVVSMVTPGSSCGR